MFRLSLNRVHDKVRITESGEKITLAVDGDAARMVRALTGAQKSLNAVKGESTDEDRISAAKQFAAAIFGADQAEKLVQFYHGDAVCVIEACGRYFSSGLAKKITKAQKK
jgi:hypothetical protein